MDQITLRPLTAEEIDRALLRDFCRRQEVTHCWRKVDGAWCMVREGYRLH